MSGVHAGRLKLLLLAALFFAPVIAAVGIYFYAPEWFSGRINYGTLISPVRPVPALALADATGAPSSGVPGGKWTLVYLGGATCGPSCQERLVLVRQVQRALGRDSGRVQRVYLAPSAAQAQAARDQLAGAHPDLVVLAETEPRAAAFFKPADADALFLLDPLGNWVMAYSGAIKHKGLHRDLKKLLRVSRVG